MPFTAIIAASFGGAGLLNTHLVVYPAPVDRGRAFSYPLLYKEMLMVQIEVLQESQES
jgi:hypothetical protein